VVDRLKATWTALSTFIRLASFEIAGKPNLGTWVAFAAATTLHSHQNAAAGLHLPLYFSYASNCEKMLKRSFSPKIGLLLSPQEDAHLLLKAPPPVLGYLFS
jgi:hypothetical protein